MIPLPHAVQYMHITDRERCNWLRARIETPEQFRYSEKKKLHILDRLAWAEMFEGFLANKYSAAKRFGLEGCEVLIPGMKALIDEAADRGMESVVIGMPHRGACMRLDLMRQASLLSVVATSMLHGVLAIEQCGTMLCSQSVYR